MRYAIDPTKIHKRARLAAGRRSSTDGIQKTIQWYLENRDWWEAIVNGEYQNYYERMYAGR